MRFKPTQSESFAVCLIVLAVLAIFLDSAAIRRQHNSCALCRLTRYDSSGLGRRWSEPEETACSKWYPDNIEREHEHAWARSPSTQLRTVFGTPRGIGDSDRPAGFLKLTPDEQIEVYRHIPNVDEAQRLFLRMRDDMESGDPARHRRVQRTSAALRDWTSSGLRREWEDVRTEIGGE